MADQTVFVGDKDVTIDDFYHVAVNHYRVGICDGAISRIGRSRETVEQIVLKEQIVYGINTGFGSLSNQTISGPDLEKLQLNLIRSHAIGCGDPAPPPVVRGMLFLRLVCICRGHSGVRIEVAKKLIEALNRNYLPFVPELGTVGASGDLAPLSHLALGLIGEGQAFCHRSNCFRPSAEVMKNLGMEPLTLKAKEGLALNNGTQFITSYTALALYEAKKILRIANFIAALSVEALHGTDKAFDSKIHQAKPHPGQIEVARALREHLCPKGVVSEINRVHTGNKVQDAYSLRCIPQIHGAATDLIRFVEGVVVTEMNSANDNPLIFESDSSTKFDTKSEVISGGNFHGMYVGMAADNISLAMSYLCNISERRLERMVNPALNKFLPSFLIANAGLNSGLMIAQYAAAGITAENRQLANPSSVHNIPTCQGTEDVVSMAGHSSRKALNSVENTYRVLAYELLTAYQAHHFTEQKPHENLNQVLDFIGKNLPQIENDSYMKSHFDFIYHYIRNDTGLIRNTLDL